MNNQNKNLLFWAAIFVVLIIGFNVIQGDNMIGSKEQIPLSDVLTKIDAKQVSSVKIQGRTLEGRLIDGTVFSSYFGDYPDIINRLNDSAAQIEVLPPDTKMNSLLSIVISWFPMFLFIGVWVFFMRKMQGGSGKALYFGKSKAKLVSDQGKKITFKDFAGSDEAKDELQEVVEFLRDPGRFQALGGKIPKGILLVGPPGTGKTLIAKATAGEANVAFFSISGSEFVEMFVGVGASRVRDMFRQGKESAPCIIFIDEIDAVGRHRGIGLGGGNDEREQTLNQMLVEMDGFEANEGVVILAATNRPDVLDPALLRPGRFDKQIILSNPDIKGREQILRVHLAKVKHDSDVDPRIIARGTPGLPGAALANLINESALIAAKKNKKAVSMRDLEEAKDKVIMGAERRSMVITEEQKRRTAYHEAGHALVALHAKSSDPIHKATIIPRHMSLGMVMRLPVDDRLSYTREQLESDIAVCFGGRIAEEVIFGKDQVATGASEDIKQATKIAWYMVTEVGLSEKVGPINYARGNDSPYSSNNFKHVASSEKTAELIEAEVRNFIDAGYNFAKKVITKHLDELHIVAKQLIERETLSGEEISDLVFGSVKNNNDTKKKREKKDKSTLVSAKAQESIS